MPYIVKEDREKYEQYIQPIVWDLQENEDIDHEFLVSLCKQITTAGEANYVLSSIIWRLFDADPSYAFGNQLMASIEDAKLGLVDEYESSVSEFVREFCCELQNGLGLSGMLACVAFEFYRRRLGPYEDLAIKRNGDIL